MKQSLPFLIIGSVLIAALLAVWYLKRPAAETPLAVQPGAALPKPAAGRPRLGAEPPHRLGNADAPVMLEEFGDFECQACAALHPALKTIKADFGSRVVIVFREFPLASVHQHTLAAARAAEAAGLQGKFWEMHDLLYENQKDWHVSSDVESLFEQYAKQIGLQVERFKQDINGEAVTGRVTLDQERGRWIGVNSTPTIFLNGREVPPESLTLEKLRALINAL